jgi:hypothetical protein
MTQKLLSGWRHSTQHNDNRRNDTQCENQKGHSAFSDIMPCVMMLSVEFF